MAGAGRNRRHSRRLAQANVGFTVITTEERKRRKKKENEEKQPNKSYKSYNKIINKSTKLQKKNIGPHGS